MKFYDLAFAFNWAQDNNAIVALHGDMKGIGAYDLEKGKAIDNWDKEFAFFYNPDKGTNPSDYLANNLGWLIVSMKVKKVFENYRVEGIQLLPILLRNQKDNNTSKDYFVVNFTKLFEGIFDFDATKYIGPKPPPERIEFQAARFYALREAKAEGLHLFKIKECPSPIFISEALKKEIKKQKLTGFSFGDVIMV